MKTLVIACFVALVALSACSESTSSNEPQLMLQTEIDGAALTAAYRKDISAQSGDEVDSIHITRTRVLVSEIKLHAALGDSINGGKKLKAGPAVLTFDSSGTRNFTQTPVPAGTYNRIKFEFHKFSSSEADQYKSTPEFADFITPDRATFIIDGFYYKNGVRTAFSFRSDKTANLTLFFFPPIDVKSGVTSTVIIRMKPSGFLKKAAKCLDPHDDKNKGEIADAFENALSAILRGL